MKLTISPDRLKAYLIFESEDEIGRRTFEEIIKFIRDNGVVYGIKSEKIRRFLEDPCGEREVLVAEGVPPEDGRDGYIAFEFDVNRRTLIKNIKAGTKIAVIYPPTRGSDGVSVTGEVIKARDGEEVRNVYLGKNVAFSDDNRNVIVATADGNLVINEDGTIEVSPILEIQGNTAPEEINFIGTLIVRGDIKSGSRVRVEKNLEVYGNIEDADVQVGGNVLIGGGFVGYGKGNLYARGNVSVKFITNQTLVADGNIILRREAVNANIVCGGKVIAKDAVIIGGTIVAKSGIEVKTIGGAEYSRTIVVIGKRDRKIERLKSVMREIKRLEEYHEGVKSEIYNLARLKVEWGELPEEQEKQLQNLIHWRDEIPRRIEQLENLRKRLLEDIRHADGAKLVVYGTIYKNTLLEINGAKEEITFDMRRSIFEEENGMVVRTKIREDYA
jgi:hypothetical protein